jgi:hypothetical protein
MKPSRLLLQLLLAWLLLGLLAALATILEWPRAFEIKAVFWSWLALSLTLALLDAYALRRPRLVATRALEPHLALGVRQQVEIRLENHEPRRLELWLTDFPPAQLQLKGLPVRLELEPEAHARVRYSITPLRRGLAEFDRVCCRVLSGWRLWEKNYYYGEAQRSKIYPNYKPLFRSSFIGSDQLYTSGCSCVNAAARAPIFTSYAIFASAIRCARSTGARPPGSRSRYRANTRKSAISRSYSCWIAVDACAPATGRSVISTMRSMPC